MEIEEAAEEKVEEESKKGKRKAPENDMF